VNLWISADRFAPLLQLDWIEDRAPNQVRPTDEQIVVELDIAMFIFGRTGQELHQVLAGRLDALRVMVQELDDVRFVPAIHEPIVPAPVLGEEQPGDRLVASPDARFPDLEIQDEDRLRIHQSLLQKFRGVRLDGSRV